MSTPAFVIEWFSVESLSGDGAGLVVVGQPEVQRHDPVVDAATSVPALCTTTS